jgi:hypothetical protein
MHPLRFLLPPRVLVSHVTKSGYSSDSDELLRLVLLPSRPASEKNDVRLDDLLAASDAVDEAFVVASDGVLEAAEGTEDDEAVEGLGTSSLLIAAGLADICSGAPLEASVSKPPPTALSSVENFCFSVISFSSELSWYLAQSSAVVLRESGGYFSRLALRHSKQKAQCASVAI